MENSSDSISPLLSAASCLICYETVNYNSILHCQHQICEKCIKEFLNSKIVEGSVLNIKCPVTSCSELLSESFITSIISPDYHEKFKLFVQKKTLEQNLNFRWCPVENCSGFSTRNDENSFKLVCNKCSIEFCYRCAEYWHDGKQCNIWTDLKFCPKCFCLTQKNGGCPMITCSKCSEKWCWICGNSFENHDATECFSKNKGFSIYEVFILFLIFFPIVYPFMVFILFVMILIFEDAIRHEGGFEGFEKVIKYKYCALFSSFVISPFFMIVATILFPFIYGICIPLNIFIDRSEEMSWKTKICYFLLAFLLPLFIGIFFFIIAVVFCILPVVGIGFMIAKIYFLISK